MAIFPPLDSGDKYFLLLSSRQKLGKLRLRETMPLAEAADVGGPVLDAGSMRVVQ